MNKKHFNLRSRKLIFAKWSRKPNSVFLSLGRTIKVAVLSASYFILNAFNTIAQTDTLKIQEITVSAFKTPVTFADAPRIVSLLSAKEIEEAPLTSVQDALKSSMNVDLRERGVYGLQSDLNIRGGSFEQNTVLINGVRMNDPQTGHFQLNLPVDLIDIERIELLHGASSGLYGNNAFTGAVNFITGNETANEIKAGVLAGEHELYAGNLALNLSTKNFKNYLSVSRKTSAGYIENTDFSIFNLFGKSKLITNAGSLQLQAGYLDKSFGANNFYTPVYPNQYEQNKTWMANLKFFSSSDIKFNPSVYWRRNFDRFELFRDNPPSWYTNHNYHVTDVYGADINTQFNSNAGQTAIGADWNTEAILSNKLGEELDNSQDIPGVDNVAYTHGKTRQNLNFFLEQLVKIGKTNISVQLATNYNSMFNWNIYPGVGISYQLSNRFNLISSVNWSGRAPSYTELYYVGGGNTGNPNLKIEKATTYEVGNKYISKALIFQSCVFYRQGTDIIDWIKSDPNENWESNNITNINTFGVEFLAKIMPKHAFGEAFPVKSIQLSYTYLDMVKNSNQYFSKYVLDYLRHNALFAINHDIIKNLSANWSLNFQYRNGSYLPYNEENGEWAFREPKKYEPLFLLDFKINYNLKNITLYLQAKNLLDTKYQNQENVFLPGRWVSGGLIFNLKI